MRKKLMTLFLLSTVVLVFTACASSVSIEQFETYRSASEERMEKLEKELSQVCATQEHLVDEADLRILMDEVGSALGSLEMQVVELETMMSTLALHKDVAALEDRVGTMIADYEAARRAFDELARHAGYEEPVQLVLLGRDIIDVNRNIASIDAKIERLRAVMRQFAEP